MGYFDAPEPRNISERRLLEREADCRKEGCPDCGCDYLPGFVDPDFDPDGNGWTLACSSCRYTHDVWEAQREADEDRDTEDD